MNLREAFNREFRRQLGSRGRSERYAKKGDQGSFGWAKKDDQKQFRWITLNGGSGPDGHGGTPVLIDAKGTIQGGPKTLEGKSLGKLDKGKTGTSRDKRKGNTPPEKEGTIDRKDGGKKVHGVDGSQFTDRGLKWWNQMNVAWDAINNPTERQRDLIRDYRRSRSRSGRKEALAALAVDILGSRDSTWIEAALQGEAPIPSLLGDDYLPQKKRNEEVSRRNSEAMRKRQEPHKERSDTPRKPSLPEGVSTFGQDAYTAGTGQHKKHFPVKDHGGREAAIEAARVWAESGEKQARKVDRWWGGMDRDKRDHMRREFNRLPSEEYDRFDNVADWAYQNRNMASKKATPEPKPDVGELAREAIAQGENVRGLFRRRGISLHKDRDLTLAVGDEINRLKQQRYSRLTSQINAEFSRRSVRRYEQPTGGRWVTLNGDGEGKGSKVFIEGGEITKGPKALTGKPISEVDKGKEGTSKDKRKNNAPPRPNWMKKQPSPDLPKDDDGNFTLRRDKSVPDFMPPKTKARDLFGDEPPLSPTDGPDMLPGATKPLTPLQRRADGQVTGATQVHYSDLKVDPKRFQYKFEGIGDDGVTDELKGVRKFNPMLGGQLLAWFDPEDGQSYVVNGHHRHELARRSGEHEGWDGNMPVYFVDAKTPKAARALGALANIAEGRGTAVDAAKFLRDTGVDAQQLYDDHGISLKGAVARDAQTLTKLADPLFQKLAEGMMTTGRALAISSELSDHGKQAELLGQIEKTEAKRNKDLPDAAVREMAKMMDLASTTSQQGGLFDDFAERSSFVERAELMAGLRRTLSSDRNTFRQASSTRRQSALESTGTNTLDVEGNRQRAQAADVALFDFDARANARGDEIATAISEAAEELADAPRKRKSIEKRLIGRVRELLGEADDRGAGRSGQGVTQNARRRNHRQPARYARQRERMIRQMARRLKL